MGLISGLLCCNCEPISSTRARLSVVCHLTVPGNRYLERRNLHCELNCGVQGPALTHRHASGNIQHDLAGSLPSPPIIRRHPNFFHFDLEALPFCAEGPSFLESQSRIRASTNTPQLLLSFTPISPLPLFFFASVSIRFTAPPNNTLSFKIARLFDGFGVVK